MRISDWSSDVCSSDLGKLAALEDVLAAIAARLASTDDAAALLDELCELSAKAAAITTATGFRMSATAAYAQIAQDRLASLECTDVAGFQSLTEFTDRRLLPDRKSTRLNSSH